MMKQVTIAMCSYNYEKCLAAAIDSTLAQDYPAIPVLVVDDGSTDGSRAIIESYGDRVRSLRNKNGEQLSSPLSDFAVRYIANPLARRGVAGR